MSHNQEALTPRFRPEVVKILDDAPDDLNEKIWDVIDMVCQHSTSRQARRRLLRSETGASGWVVAIPRTDWYLIWAPMPDQIDQVLITYVGPVPRAR